MHSLQYQTIVVPVTLGQVSNFNRTIFPLSYQKRGSLGLGDLYLDATLDEMIKITKVGASPQRWQEFIESTKDRYDRLLARKEELEQRPKSKNPFKAFANYRAARMFLVASKSLYFATKSRSEQVMRSVGRSLLSVPGEDIQPAASYIPPDANISGIAVKLDRPLDDNTRQQLLDAANTMASCPFEVSQAVTNASNLTEYFSASDSLICSITDASESEETHEVAIRPTSSPTTTTTTTTINHVNLFFGSVRSRTLKIVGGTTNVGGQDNSGSVNHIIETSNTT